MRALLAAFLMGLIAAPLIAGDPECEALLEKHKEALSKYPPVLQEEMREVLCGRYSELALERRERLRKQIRLELQAASTFHWPGEYSADAGHLCGTQLLIAPGAGFIYEGISIFGMHSYNQGSAEFRDGALMLSFLWPNDSLAEKWVSEEMIVVPWSQNVYLVPKPRMIHFCNTINANMGSKFPPYLGEFLSKSTYRQSSLAGQPLVPEEYRKYLLVAPIEASILSVEEIKEETLENGVVVRSARASVSAGADQGLHEGMTVYTRRGAEITLSTVENSRSKGKFTSFDNSTPLPVVGEPTSTARNHAETIE